MAVTSAQAHAVAEVFTHKECCQDDEATYRFQEGEIVCLVCGYVIPDHVAVQIAGLAERLERLTKRLEGKP